jgi:hypothetical protein
MKLLKFFSILIIVFLTSNYGQAQMHQHPECLKHREVIKAERVAYLTEKLDLSVKEAQNFWPIYNAYQKEIENLRDEKHKSIFQMNEENNNLTEAEYQEILNQYFAFSKKEATLKENYQKNLSKVLSAKKIYLLYSAEKSFKRKLVKDLRGRKPACIND